SCVQTNLGNAWITVIRAAKPAQKKQAASPSGGRAAAPPRRTSSMASPPERLPKTEGRRPLGGTGAATATLDWGESRALRIRACARLCCSVLQKGDRATGPRGPV